MSNETRWTPGPWVKSSHVDPGDGVEVKDERGLPVCRCMVASIFDGGPVKSTTHKQRNANAHLIAAAPEMYQALQDMITSYEVLGSPLQMSREIEVALDALAKARGEAQ